jgi:hypothetical protein
VLDVAYGGPNNQLSVDGKQDARFTFRRETNDTSAAKCRLANGARY